MARLTNFTHTRSHSLTGSSTTSGHFLFDQLICSFDLVLFPTSVHQHFLFCPLVLFGGSRSGPSEFRFRNTFRYLRNLNSLDFESVSFSERFVCFPSPFVGVCLATKSTFWASPSQYTNLPSHCSSVCLVASVAPAVLSLFLFTCPVAFHCFCLFRYISFIITRSHIAIPVRCRILFFFLHLLFSPSCYTFSHNNTFTSGRCTLLMCCCAVSGLHSPTRPGPARPDPDRLDSSVIHSFFFSFAPSFVLSSFVVWPSQRWSCSSLSLSTTSSSIFNVDRIDLPLLSGHPFFVSFALSDRADYLFFSLEMPFNRHG